MGKKPERPERGDLVNAAVPVQPTRKPASYPLADPDECEEYERRVVLSAENQLYVRFQLWKDRLIVEFTVGQIVRYNGRWVEVARIDSCHNSIHKHQLSKSAPRNTTGQRAVLEEIPHENPWSCVDRWYDLALTKMQNEWTENIRRWRVG
ncbi:MAG: hypothetical protein QOI74_2702 [Micromonosporaceae bacterium]|nr:hypothetical protein [Micromonosporaceae bacterium]